MPSPPRVRPAALDSMAHSDVLAVLAASNIGRELTADQRRQLVDCARIARYDAAEQTIVATGEVADDFYVILEGEVSVRHVEPAASSDASSDPEPVELARLGPGQTFGEAALADGLPRLADVVTLGPTRLLLIDIGGLLHAPDAADWVRPFILALTRGAGERMQSANATAVEALQREMQETRRRLAMGHFLMWIIVGMSLYTFSLGFTLSMTDSLALASLCTNAVILLSVYAMWRLVSQSPYPRSTFGLVVNPGWRGEVIEALVWSLGLIVLATACKWVLIQTVPALADVPVFDSAFVGTRPLGTAEIVFAITYFLLSPVQEMIARGCLQSSLDVFLHRPGARGWMAIILSNLIFSTNHVHLSLWFAVMAFVPGIAWGVLYRKQGSLLGVAISHAIVGTYALKVLGLDLLARM